jgi:hypothetical protein
MDLSVAPGTAPGTYQVPLDPSFTYGDMSYPMAAAGLTADVPYTSLQAAYDSRAISDNNAITEADFDGQGDSYSEQALTAAGLPRGATVTVAATTLQWPDVPAGTADSVLAKGQTILMPASSAATRLAFIGASSIDSLGTLTIEDTGTGTIEYTDGTDQSYRLTLDDWFKQPTDSSNITVATAAYVNDSTKATNHGVAGRRNQKARVFAVSIPLEPGKTVSSVTLPEVATLPGVYPMHVFALALGGGST